MSKAPRKPVNPRTKASAADREQARLLREDRIRRNRRRRVLISVGAPVLVVVLIVATFLIIKVNQKPAAPTGASAVPAGSALESTLKAIPASTFDAVGTGTGVVPPTAGTGAALTAAGKPRVLYIGAEFCPYCAAERWAVVAALSRFGTFDGLGVTTSAAKDVFPSTATLSFSGATYTSNYLSFTGVEITSNVPDESSAMGYAVLDTLSAGDAKINSTLNPKGSIPFVDLGNKFLISGASFDPQVLQGLTQAQIAAQLGDPGSAVAKQAIGAANMMTAALCRLTQGQPAAVCTSPAVTTQQLP